MKLKAIVCRTASSALLSALAIGLSAAPRAALADGDGPQPGTGPLANYTILKTTDFGKSIIRDFPAGTTARQVVKATVPDLTAFFGEKPQLVGIYQDQKDKKSAVVFFSENLNGQPVKGLSVIKVADDATHEWLVFCLASAPKGEATKLLSLDKPPAQAAGSDSATPAANDGSSSGAGSQLVGDAHINLQTYNFPDGTGSIGVPDGWTCNSQTIGGAVVRGPADQAVALDIGGQVDVPNGQTLRMAQMGGQNPATILVAPFSPDPATALTNLIEAMNRVQQTRAGPVSTVDQVINQQPRQPGPGMTDGHAAVIELAMTRTLNGQSRKFHSIQLFAVFTFNGGQDTWNFYGSQELAPEETFKQDLPVMNAIFDSLKENGAAIQAKGEAEGKEVQQIVDATRQMNIGVQGTVDRMHADEIQTERSFADVDEGIIGTRTVYDLQTGEQADVNLGDVNGVVDALNEADPGRFIQIPLRDTIDPNE
jgi:hypothetical protein